MWIQLCDFLKMSHFVYYTMIFIPMKFKDVGDPFYNYKGPKCFIQGLILIKCKQNMYIPYAIWFRVMYIKMRKDIVIIYFMIRFL